MLKVIDLSATIGSFKLANISFEVDAGAYFVLAGPSGSGKSLLLEAIAGLYRIDVSGKILLNNRDISHSKIQDRSIGLVFQDNTLFPHLSVQKNIEFALKLKKRRSAENTERLKLLSQQLFISDLLHRNPTTLSGGETQRVLLARTLAAEPQLILLDEPLSAVDSDQKDQLKSLLRKLHRSGQTIIHVTHDFEEAFSLATKIGMMHNGELLETGAPESILNNPGSKFVARFCGYKNYFSARANQSGFALVNDKVKFSHPEFKNKHGEISFLIDATKINIPAKAKDQNFENNFKGVIKDIFKSVNGMEFTVDIGVDLNVAISNNTYKDHPFDINHQVYVTILQEAFSIIGVHR